MGTKEKNLIMPSITAQSAEEFAEITAKIQQLPQAIIEQIQLAYKKHLLGIECTLKQNIRDNKIILPRTTSQIKDFGDYIGVYAEGFFFVIEGELKKKPIQYFFYTE